MLLQVSGHNIFVNYSIWNLVSCVFLFKNILAWQNGKLVGHLPFTSLSSLGGCHDMVSYGLPGSDEVRGFPPTPLKIELRNTKPLSCSPEGTPQQPSATHLIADNCSFFVSVLFFLVCRTNTKGVCTLKAAYSTFTLWPVRPHPWLGVCLTNMSNWRADVGWGTAQVLCS